eukprot:TRINITY_DN1031_c0_g1_i1.p1 TRINITY_DN1031_c0_g1~~TRINITY_DN1031_c0_g1_i1.p1  ORF type:complete len:229 (+),score=46.99 TRINITY_DN1031_c0_g1_i1:38-724(+)
MSTSCPVGQFVLSITAMNLGNAPLSAFVSPLQPSRAPVAAPAEILRSRQPAATGAGAEVLLGAQESSALQNAASAHSVALAAISAIGGCCLGFSFRAPRRGARLALKAGGDEEAIDATGLPDVIEMDQHARADLVERLTKEGMKLIEAGKVDEAQEKFAKMNRIVALFERLTRPPEDESKPKKRHRTDAAVMSEEHALASLHRELGTDDFVGVFGGISGQAGFTGGWR